MRPLARLGFAIVLAGATALVSGCDSLDTLTLFDSKTKLSGDRKPVFPEGVPGVTPGVPPEMVKGYREPVVEAPPPALPGEQPKAEAKPKAAEAKPKPTPKPHTIQAAAKPKPAPAVQAQASPPPAPAAAAAPWPNQPQQPQPQPQAQAAPWPSAPASGTVSR
jgi:hypothetical protein